MAAGGDEEIAVTRRFLAQLKAYVVDDHEGQVQFGLRIYAGETAERCAACFGPVAGGQKEGRGQWTFAHKNGYYLCEREFAGARWEGLQRRLIGEACRLLEVAIVLPLSPDWHSASEGDPDSLLNEVYDYLRVNWEHIGGAELSKMWEEQLPRLSTWYSIHEQHDSVRRKLKEMDDAHCATGLKPAAR